MSGRRASAVAAVARLRGALEQTAGALATADLEQLLQSEGAIEFALRSLPRAGSLDPEDRLALRDEIVNARLALMRCRRLGDALLDVVAATFEAQGRASGYGRKDVPAMAYARSFDTRG